MEKLKELYNLRYSSHLDVRERTSINWDNCE